MFPHAASMVGESDVPGAPSSGVVDVCHFDSTIALPSVGVSAGTDKIQNGNSWYRDRPKPRTLSRYNAREQSSIGCTDYRQ